MSNLLFKTLLVCVLLGSVIYAVNIASKSNTASGTKPNSVIQNETTSSNNPKPTVDEYTGTLSSSIFVTYWMLPDGNIEIPNVANTTLDTIIYFGITPGENGVNKSEPGYANVSTFARATSSFTGNTLLTIRMSNEDQNTEILRSQSLQDRLIVEALNVANGNKFDGIVLDLEHSVIPTENTTNDIVSFVSNLCSKARAIKLSCSIALFGDTYYRARPYNVPAIQDQVDTIYIMAYDFHKSFGEPGPNFPHTKGSTYPYSIEAMLSNYLEDVPADKISVLFGMFGYDWTVDKQNRPLKPAEPLTLAQIQARTQPECPYTACRITKDETSSETTVTYRDETEQPHTIWFEDLNSVEAKITTLREYGISQIGYWAYGYY